MKRNDAVKDMSKLAALHFIVRFTSIAVGLALGGWLKEDMAVTIAVITSFLTTFILDVRLLTFSQINSTYGEVTHIEDNKSGRKVTVTYKPFLKSSTQYEVDSESIVFIKHKERLKTGEKVLVEYQRGNEWIAVGGPFAILSEILSNVSNAFMVSHFLVLLVHLIM